MPGERHAVGEDVVVAEGCEIVTLADPVAMSVRGIAVLSELGMILAFEPPIETDAD